MDPRAWVEFPFSGVASKATESKNSRVEKALIENRVNPTGFKGIPVYAGEIPAATVFNGFTYPGVISGETLVSEFHDGFVKGLNISTISEGLLLSCNFSDSPFRIEKLSIGSICGRNTGEKYLQWDFPTRRKSVFFWKIENPIASIAKINFLLPFVEVRR